jgi:hypothetical protein
MDGKCTVEFGNYEIKTGHQLIIGKSENNISDGRFYAVFDFPAKNPH